MSFVKTKYLDITNGGSQPFILSCGEKLDSCTLAYETHGTLNDEATNAILVFHALSGSHHIAGTCPELDNCEFWGKELQEGWWDSFVGPQRALDTDKYYVICVNYLGGCYGSTGPSSIDSKTQKPYGSSFPEISFSDIVRSQKKLLEDLKINKLHALVGASVGGFCALDFALRYPDVADNISIIASSKEVSTLQRLHNFEQIRAIEADSNFNFGDYYSGEAPKKGLTLARMIAHKTYISLATLNRRASSKISKEIGSDSKNYQVKHPVESYMRHHGLKFTKRFDANSYLKIVTAWQGYDLLKEFEAKSFKELFKRCKNQKYLVLSIDSDVCFYPEDQASLVGSLKEAEVSVRHITVHSEKGHDAFLLESELFEPYIKYHLS